MALSELRISDTSGALEQALVSIGFASGPESAKTLTTVARKVSANPEATILEFLKSEDFMHLLTGNSSPVETNVLVCPHCGELLIS